MANVTRVTLDDRQPVGKLPQVHEAWLPREHSLHRPRHGGRQLTALVSALVFFTAPTFMWLFGMRPVELENHALKGFPSLLGGWSFFTDMDPWASDNLVFKAEAIRSADWASRTFFGEPPPFDQGGPKPAGPLPGSPGSPGAGGGSGGSTDPGDPGADTGSAGYRRVIEGDDGWLYLGQDIVDKCEPRAPIDRTIREIAKLREAVEESGRTFIMVAVPDKTTMVPENLPDDYPGKDCAREATPGLWRELTTVAHAVDMRPSLQAAANTVKHPVYFPLDSHWTSEGALMMVRQLAEHTSPGVTASWRFDPTGEQVADADLPPLIGQTGQNRGLGYEFKPDGETNRTGSHLKDPRQPERRTSEPIEGMVDKRTLVLGDSFMLPASPYLPAAFADVTQLYYTTAEGDPGLVARTMADNDVVVLEMVERNIARGDIPLLDDKFVNLLRKELRKHPIR